MLFLPSGPVWPVVSGRRGEARVEGAIRFLLGSQQALNSEEAARLTEDNAPVPATTIAIDPVSLTVSMTF